MNPEKIISAEMIFPNHAISSRFKKGYANLSFFGTGCEYLKYKDRLETIAKIKTRTKEEATHCIQSAFQKEIIEFQKNNFFEHYLLSKNPLPLDLKQVVVRPTNPLQQYPVEGAEFIVEYYGSVFCYLLNVIPKSG